MKEQNLSDRVVLVNEYDAVLDVVPKLEAHERGLLHRAFSVFLFNSAGELLLQQRALTKYHSPGLWSNSCCSHPYLGEVVKLAAQRRLYEEMGINCDVQKAFHFIYKAQVDGGLIEHEYDHVFFGQTDMLPEINKEEVQDWKYIRMDVLADELQRFPENYTSWLKIAFDRVFTLRNNETL